MGFNFPSLITLAFAVSGIFHTARAAASTTTSLPAILYPTGLPVINYLDTIAVTYESSWPGGANLSANCQEALNSTEWCWLWALNPVTDNGTFVFQSMGTELLKYIVEFPTNCWFNLYPNRASEGKAVVGGNFTMTYTAGSATTWAAYATSATSLPPTSTTSATATSQKSSVTTSATGSPSSSGSPPPASSGLSTGAKAGIGVGAGLGGLLLLGAFGYIIRLHKSLAKTKKRTSTIQHAEKEWTGDLQEAYEKQQSNGPLFEKGADSVREV